MRAPHRLAVPALLALATALACSEPEEQCATGETRCGVVCRDLLTSPSACGDCFTTCPLGAACVDGDCLCPAETPDTCAQPGHRPTCVDLQADPENCGSCGLACGLGQCVGGACQCDPAPPVITCADAAPPCVNGDTDPRHCGSCDAVCGGATPDCAAGQCECSAPRTPCNGTTCVDTATSTAHCGGCNQPCTVTGQLCSGGSCACPPSSPATCSGACVSTQTDELNCGSCGTRCATGQTCGAGTCACPAGLKLCGSGPAAACEATGTDEANCGACGHACVSDQTCSAGACSCGPDQRACPKVGGNEVECCPGSGCQTDHPNGLGQHYYDCAPLDAHTKAQALLAADAWNPTGQTYDGESVVTACGLSCLCRQTSSQVAVWCYGQSPLSGYARAAPSLDCGAACPVVGQNPWR